MWTWLFSLQLMDILSSVWIEQYLYFWYLGIYLIFTVIIIFCFVTVSPINRYSKVHVLWFTNNVIIIIISHDSTSSLSVGEYFAFAVLWFTVSHNNNCLPHYRTRIVSNFPIIICEFLIVSKQIVFLIYFLVAGLGGEASQQVRQKNQQNHQNQRWKREHLCQPGLSP